MSKKKGHPGKSSRKKTRKENTPKIKSNIRVGLKLAASQDSAEPPQVCVAGCEESQSADLEWFRIRPGRAFRLRAAATAEANAFREVHGRSYSLKAGFFTVVYQVEPGAYNHLIFSGEQTSPHLKNAPELFCGDDDEHGYFDRAISCLRNILEYQQVANLHTVAEVAMRTLTQRCAEKKPRVGAQ